MIDADGQNHGVVSKIEALERAREAGLDLVEVSPDANPPVAKILDYGKFKYQEQKKAAEARKKQKTVEVKEIKMRPNIDDHDYNVKMKSMERFFVEGDKVKVTLRFRGREMAHQQLGRELLLRVKADTEEIAKVESEPRLEGRQMVGLGIDNDIFAEIGNFDRVELLQRNSQPFDHGQIVEAGDLVRVSNGDVLYPVSEQTFDRHRTGKGIGVGVDADQNGVFFFKYAPELLQTNFG